MSDEPAAVALRCGPLRLMLGSEEGITAAEVVTTGDQTRLDLEDLRGVTHQLNGRGGELVRPEVLFIVDNHVEFLESMADGVAVETYGPDDAALTAQFGKLNPEARKGILTEAALAAWGQRLADAADSLDQLTNAEAGIIGRLKIPGNPLLTELRADRRRAFHSATQLVGSFDNVETTVDAAIVDLHAAVRFGAAGFVETPDGDVGKALQTACGHDGWANRLKLLIAAEEVCAIELFASAGNRLTGNGAGDSSSEIFDQLLAKYWSHRQQAEALAALLDDVIARLPTAPENPVTRVLRRTALRDTLVIRDIAEAYSAVVRTSNLLHDDGTTWLEAAKSVAELDLITFAPWTDDGNGRGPHSDERTTQSVRDAAALLGELFAQQLPAARTLVESLTQQHPGVDTEGLVRMVKRQGIRKLVDHARQDDAQQSVQEIVALLAMAIALLRGIEPHTEAEFQKIGQRMLERASKIANLRAQAGDVLPRAFEGFERFARHIQPAVAEFLFHAMGGLKPQHAGAARDAFKAFRSRVWRARYNKVVREATVGGAGIGLLKAIDAAAPRLIVRYIDQSLPAPKL